MAGFHAVGWQIALLVCYVAAFTYSQTPQTAACERSYSENDGVVMLCTTLASTFGGSEIVGVSSAGGSASAEQDYSLIDTEVQITLDQTGRDLMSACARLLIINDRQSEGSEFFNLNFIQQSSSIVVASCQVEITDGVSGFPFLECQESLFIAEEGGVAEVCFVLRNAEALESQTTITANVYPQYIGTANASMDYNMSSTQVVLHSGVTEVACVNITIHRDGTPERVENFYVVGVPNGMAGTPVGGDSCEVLIIDGDGPDVECPEQLNRTVSNFRYLVQPGGAGVFMQELYGDEYCFDPTVDIYTPGELCSTSGVLVRDCTQWNSDRFDETVQSQSFRQYVPLLTETGSDNTCLMQVRSRVARLYARTTVADIRNSCTTNCVMSVVQNDCDGVDFLLDGVYIPSVVDLLSDLPLNRDNCYLNLSCCETQIPVECADEDTVSTGTQPPFTSSNRGNRGNSSITDGLSVGVAVGASIGGVLIMSLVALIVVLVMVLLCYRSRKRSQVYKSQISGGEVESREPAPQPSQSVLDDHVYEVAGNDNQEVYEEITLHIGKFDQYGKWRQVFEGRIIDQSHLVIGNSLGEGAFGKVYKGKLWSDTKPPSSKQVAIKTLKKASSREEIEDFMAEPALMQDFEHCNVLGLLGVCFDTHNYIPLVVLPYMENGDLRSFLKSKRLADRQRSKEMFPEGLSESILMGMCLDVAVGMQYLATHKFVHRDLSARNCIIKGTKHLSWQLLWAETNPLLVDVQLQVRVADFGLSRDICNSDYYRLMHNARLPVKWMSPESLYDNLYTEKTDVWSFGVVCWEVFSLGRKPYPGVDNMDIPDHISNGHRLKKPTLCPEDLYESMLSTWEYHPGDRPTFDELVKLVASFYQPEDAAEHEYFVLEKPTKSTKEPFCADTKACGGGEPEDADAHLYTDVDFDCAQDKPSYMNVSRGVHSAQSGENSQQNTVQYEVPMCSPHRSTDQQTAVPMEYEVPTSTTSLPQSVTPLPNGLPSNPDGDLYHTLESHMYHTIESHMYHTLESHM